MLCLALNAVEAARVIATPIADRPIETVAGSVSALASLGATCARIALARCRLGLLRLGMSLALPERSLSVPAIQAALAGHRRGRPSGDTAPHPLPEDVVSEAARRAARCAPRRLLGLVVRGPEDGAQSLHWSLTPWASASSGSSSVTHRSRTAPWLIASQATPLFT